MCPAPIVPALARVFEAALAGGGAKSINFQELAADLAEITFKFPFKIPPYFAVPCVSLFTPLHSNVMGFPCLAYH